MQNQIQYLSDRLDTMQYIINNTIDISSFAKAEGQLRLNQIANAKALKIFDLICKKYNIQYWLDCGTFLGAVRHKGFIPWDDDIDLGILRDDYNKIIPILKEELEQYGFAIDEGANYEWSSILRIIYKKSSIQIDIFPYDRYYKSNLNIKEQEDLTKRFYIANNEFYKKYYPKYRDGKTSYPRKELKNLINNQILEGNLPIQNGALIRGIEFRFLDNEGKFANYDTVYPLKEIEFEDSMYLSPNNPDQYLCCLYGNWKNFPKCIYTHKDIAERARNIDLNKEIKNLDNIILKYKKELNNYNKGEV